MKLTYLLYGGFQLVLILCKLFGIMPNNSWWIVLIPVILVLLFCVLIMLSLFIYSCISVFTDIKRWEEEEKL